MAPVGEEVTAQVRVGAPVKPLVGVRVRPVWPLAPWVAMVMLPPLARVKPGARVEGTMTVRLSGTETVPLVAFSPRV